MRTKIFKMGLPVLAFIAAGVAALATPKEAPSKDAALVTGFIKQGIECVPNSRDCNNVPSSLCTTTLGQQVYMAGTACTVELFHTN